MYPALAILAALHARAEVLWVGGEGGMEASLVQREGIPFTAVPAAGAKVSAMPLPSSLAKSPRPAASHAGQCAAS